MHSSIRTIVADDHMVVRAGLRKLLEMDPEMLVVGEAVEALETVRLVNEHWPDVLVLDIQMPGMTFADIIR